MSRPRSNALTGPSDPRFRSPSEIELMIAMRTPIAVADELTTFIAKVFARRDIMEAIGDPSGIMIAIYRLYSDAAVGSQRDVKDVVAEARRGWSAIRAATRDPSVLTEAAFQNTKYRLAQDLIMEDEAVALKAANDFLYFRLRAGSAAHRVYLNLDFAAMPAFVAAIFKLDEKERSGITDFKLSGPFAGRADSVVIYCSSKESADGLAKTFSNLISAGDLQSSNQSVPAMTTRIGAGVAIGAEPSAQATGLRDPRGGNPSQQSFGTIRSEVITAAVLSYRDNAAVLGAGLETFKQLCAIGFKGFGLDPANPGS